MSPLIKASSQAPRQSAAQDADDIQENPKRCQCSRTPRQTPGNCLTANSTSTEEENDESITNRIPLRMHPEKGSPTENSSPTPL
jgi:hypothetical protein